MNFLYKKLATSEYGVSMWLRVDAFVEAIQKLLDNNEAITNSTVWPIMIEILNSYPNGEDINGIPQGLLYNAYKDVRRGSYMENCMLVGEYGRLYNRIMALRKDSDYVVNAKQMDKFLDLVQYFLKKSRGATDSKVDPNGFSPKECHGGVTATFIVFDLMGNPEVLEFCKVLKYCSAVSIDSMDNGMISISCTVPDIFVHKDEAK